MAEVELKRTDSPRSLVVVSIATTVFLVISGVAPAAGQILNDMTDALVPVESVAVSELGKTSRFEARTTPSPVEYNGIAFSAYTNVETAEGWVRFLDPDGWTDWHPMHLVFSATGGVLMGGYRGDVFRSGPAELRFSIPAGKALTVTGVGVFDNRQDTDFQAAEPGVDTPSFKTQGSLVVDPPALITRTEWQAEPFIGSPVPLANPSYEYMTFHHAAGFSATTLEEGLAQVKAIQDLHQNVRGWSDIGYQFVVDRSGRLYQGRPFLDNSTTLSEIPRLALGAHVGGANTGNIGICLLGCYHPPEGSYCRDQITTASYDTYVQTFAFLSENYGVDPARIRGHRDFSSTACPGDNNYALLCSGPDRDPSCSNPQLRVDVQTLLSNGITRPAELTLAQNFPNPFTGSTTIDYYLTAGGIVTVKVYDTLGREIDTAVDEFQEGERWYTVDFDARGLAAGTYFVRLEIQGIGNNTSSRSSTMTVVN